MRKIFLAFALILGEAIFTEALAEQQIPMQIIKDLLLELYDNSLTIAITDKNAPDADRGVIHDNDQYIIWYLTITNLVTGRQMFNGTIDELSTIINTTNWPSGAYAIQAQIGNKIVVQKQVLK